ncbi:PD-(D/E)XK nuclease family protein [Phormidium sp. LEGE 05292]|uniref:DNA translocase FtsK n=1 Tax=[Phormidium] sp. LEGE 05292 TaxID=767427 RepID=UPI001882705D|nr:DNA translocase FtsK [Phormidium sp. LEGE 05292]MBE9228199.1 PD-(D/E)XK nuclease family protein [Phormidium sp. LEGE 05292]
MLYLTKDDEIKTAIDNLKAAKILWADTEIADYNTHYKRLSLIQVLAEPNNRNGDAAYVLDVLDKHDLVRYFINQIMINSQIEKVFHNAGFDLKYLGKNESQNVTCTWKLAQKIGKESLQVTNLKLKTLAAELCQFTNVDIEEQSSDWGQRPLTDKQLQYAKMDTVYLAHVHQYLLKKTNQIHLIKAEKSEQISFNATKVRIAFECPRLFYLYQNFGGKSLFLPSDNQIRIGSAFHQLAESFIKIAKQEPKFKTIFTPPFAQLKVETVAAKMQELFYELGFYPYLQTAIQEDFSKATALYQIWQGLITLIRHWAELLVKNRRYCSGELVIGKTLISGEIDLEHKLTLPDGTQQKITGRLDSVLFDLEKRRFCVVEYKTYTPVDPSAQLAQVAIYSYIVKAKKKLPVDSAVYCVLPRFIAYYYDWEKLEETVNQIIPHKLQQMREWLKWEPSQPHTPPKTAQPHLCEICPQKEKCQTYFNTSPSLPLRPLRLCGSKTENPQLNADEIAQKLIDILQSFKIGADYQGAAIGPAFIRVKLKPNLGVKVVSILNRTADLQVQLGLENPPLIAPQAGYVSVDLPRSDRQIAQFTEYIKIEKLPQTAAVKIAIGVDLDGKLIEADLSDPNTCHFLVGGTTGSGKSEFLRSLLLSLLYRHSPNNLKIALVDPKRVTFPEFEQIPWLYSPVVKDGESAIELMTKLVTEMDRRYQIFETAKCGDIKAYNQQNNQPLPRLVCIFDEYADFMAEKEIRDALEFSIKRLGAMARAAGIHLIIATQRPEAKVVTPLIRSNLPGRVALRTASEADSVIVLGGDRKAAAYLLGKGDLLYQVGANFQRLQSLLATIIQLPKS